jgi:hypothetical protein
MLDKTAESIFILIGPDERALTVFDHRRQDHSSNGDDPYKREKH